MIKVDHALHISTSSQFSLPADTVTSSLVVYGGKGMGKRLAIDTPLPTPSGWTTMGEIREGDALFDERGETCRVTIVSPIARGDSFRINFSDGSSIVADAEHLWVTEDHRERKHSEPGRVRTTAEIRASLHHSQGFQVARNHSIRNTQPLSLPEAELPIDPYVLGLWLGNGTASAGVISAGENDVSDEAAFLSAAGCEIHRHRIARPRAPMIGIYGLKVKLRALGVLGNKHVPATYLRGNQMQRLSLLQGLLDSDGTVNGAMVEFDNTNRQLIDAVYELIVSLGMKASIADRRSVLNGVDHGQSWRIYFVATLPVFRLPRKAARLRFDAAQKLRRVRRYITAVEPVACIPMRCIAVDSPNQMYLAGREMIPTHNTNLASVLCEECSAAGLRFSFLDPMGVAWGLRHDASGKGPGIEILILGGIHGDIPIEPTAGEVVADLVADEDVSCLIDISRRADGTMWSISERIRFVTAYAKRLYRRQGEKRRALLQIIDETARFCPQVIRQGEGEVAACLGALAVLMEEGRNIGVGMALFTQRSARLNKDLAELADCMIAFRVIGPRSMDAVLDWLGEHIERTRHKEMAKALRELPRGSALVVSPGWLKHEGTVEMRARRTFDSSATPKPGERERKTQGTGAMPDLARYRARMVETITQAQANDPTSLKAKIQALEKDLRAAREAKPAACAIEKTREVRVFTKDDMKSISAIETATAKLALLTERRAELIDREAQAQQVVASETGNLLKAIGKALDKTPAPPMPAAERARAVPREDAYDDTRVGDPPRTAKKIGGAERKILAALSQYPDGRTKVQVALLTGYAHSGGGFNNALGALRSQGLLDRAGDFLKITRKGLAQVDGSVETLPTGTALRDLWLTRLAKAERAAFSVLVAAYPERLSKQIVAKNAGYEADGGGFNNALGRLRTLELIEGRGDLRASAHLFD